MPSVVVKLHRRDGTQRNDPDLGFWGPAGEGRVRQHDWSALDNQCLLQATQDAHRQASRGALRLQLHSCTVFSLFKLISPEIDTDHSHER